MMHLIVICELLLTIEGMYGITQVLYNLCRHIGGIHIATIWLQIFVVENFLKKPLS